MPEPDLRFGERAKLLDFGIAKLSGTLALSRATQAMMGTPTYMAPEQWRDTSSVDGRADVYSLGCILFEMVVGGPPFPGPTLPELCAQHTTVPPPDAAAHAAVPRPVADLIASMLVKERDQRVASMAEVARRAGKLLGVPRAGTAPHELATIVAPQAGASTTLGGGAGELSPPSSRARPRWIWPAAASVLVAAGVALTLAATRGSGDGARRPGPGSDPTAVAAAGAAPVPAVPIPAPALDAAPIPDATPADVANPFVAIASAPAGLVLGISDAAVAAGGGGGTNVGELDGRERRSAR